MVARAMPKATARARSCRARPRRPAARRWRRGRARCRARPSLELDLEPLGEVVGAALGQLLHGAVRDLIAHVQVVARHGIRADVGHARDSERLAAAVEVPGDEDRQAVARSFATSLRRTRACFFQRSRRSGCFVHALEMKCVLTKKNFTPVLRTFSRTQLTQRDGVTPDSPLWVMTACGLPTSANRPRSQAIGTSPASPL